MTNYHYPSRLRVSLCIGNKGSLMSTRAAGITSISARGSDAAVHRHSSCLLGSRVSGPAGLPSLRSEAQQRMPPGTENVLGSVSLHNLA